MGRTIKAGRRMKDIFSAALGIVAPWYIEDVKFDSNASRLDIHINFKRGARFHYESKEEKIAGDFPAYDTVNKTWRHLNFFEHDCYLHCRVPRIMTDCGKARHVKTPWEGVSSGFTLLFEAFLLQLITEMPVNAVARIAGVDDEKLWRMVIKYVNKAREYEDFSAVSKIGVDETSRKKRHDYVTVFVDLDKRKTMYVTEGKDHKTVTDFCVDLEKHKGQVESITDVSSDMSPAFIKGVKENLPNADITFDKFHIMKVINKAVGEVRKAEAKDNPLLKGTKGIFDMNRQNMNPKKLRKLETELELTKLNLKTVRAYHIKENFQAIYNAGTKEEFEELLGKWYSWARRCRLEPIKNAATTIKEHWDGVVNWFDSKINNGILEGLNSLIQSAKSKARGYRRFETFRAIIYMITGDLDFSILNKHCKA
jgi:transposase